MQLPRGFTLIELLVTITILGILASIGLVAYNQVNAGARKSKRIQDLQQISTAIEAYHSANGSYPITGSSPGTWRSECNTWGGYTSDNVIPGLVPKYMPVFPHDPAMNISNSSSCYIYASDGTDYKLLDHVISEFSAADYLSQPNLVDPRRDGGQDFCKIDGTNPWAWSVYTDGAICW